jgi:hypothetical protein
MTRIFTHAPYPRPRVSVAVQIVVGTSFPPAFGGNPLAGQRMWLIVTLDARQLHSGMTVRQRHTAPAMGAGVPAL